MSADWPILKIEDLGEVRSGKRLPLGETLVDFKTPHPYIRLVDISNGSIEKQNIRYLLPETRERIKKYIVNSGDVCLAIVGHTIGMVFFVTDMWDNVNLTENAARITNVSKKLNSKYLYYYLTSTDGQNAIISRKVGSAQGKLPLYNINNIEIPVPPRHIQDQITKILDDLNQKIHLNTQTNQTLESIAQAIFKSWFVDFEPVKAKMAVLAEGGTREQAELAAMGAISGKSEAELAQLQQQNPKHYQQLAETAALFPSAMVESELGEIPEGWEVKNIESILGNL